MEVQEEIVNELRKNFQQVIHQNSEEYTEDEFITMIFNEIDADGSGFIDRDEFRELLRKLEITFK